LAFCQCEIQKAGLTSDRRLAAVHLGRDRSDILADGFSQLIFRFAAAFGSSVLVGSPITLGSAFTYQSLFFFRPRVRSGPSFLGGSPIRTGPLLIVAHGGISTCCRESRWMGRDYTPTKSGPRRARMILAGDNEKRAA
jgi:hypothetical protein